MKNDLTGRMVTITSKDSIYYGEWGIVKGYDGEYYYIAMWNGETEMIFSRDEFRVRRAK